MKRRITALVGALAAVTTITAAGAAASVTTSHGAPSRQSRTSGIAIAGADIYAWSAHRSVDSGGGCTLAFPARSTSTGRLGALTAGHCVGTLAGGPSYAVHQTRNGPGNTTDPGLELGVVGPGGFRFGAQGDSAFVELAIARRARAAVFTGGSSSRTTIPVGAPARLHRGIHVCYSGAVSGEHCGFTVGRGPATVSFPDRGHTYRVAHEWRATRRSCPSRAGDSGSPVYVERHGVAHPVGILSGGQRRAGQCPFFFTPVKLALSRLHLQLLSR